MRFCGKARKVGDNVNTDYIISSRRKRDTLDGNILRKYFMEDLDPEFAAAVQRGDILIAGENFGCGSAMEIAAIVIKAAGIPVVIAKSFSRSFYRNGFNNGILLLEGDTSQVQSEDQIEVISDSGGVMAKNLTNGKIIVDSVPLDNVMSDILKAGGIVPYLKKFGTFRIY